MNVKDLNFNEISHIAGGKNSKTQHKKPDSSKIATTNSWNIKEGEILEAIVAILIAKEIFFRTKNIYSNNIQSLVRYLISGYTGAYIYYYFHKQ